MFQRSALQTGQDSSIYILDISLGWVYMSSVFSFAYFTHFLNLISPELMQVFANSKWYFYSFMEFYVIHLKSWGVKIWSRGKIKHWIWFLSQLFHVLKNCYREFHYFSITTQSTLWILLSLSHYCSLLTLFLDVSSIDCPSQLI